MPPWLVRLLPPLGLIIVAALIIIGLFNIINQPKQKPSASTGAITAAERPNDTTVVIENGGDLRQTLKANRGLSQFYQALEEGRQLGRLDGKAKYTVFAPTNEALALNQGTVETIMLRKRTLRRIIKLHLVKGKQRLAHLERLNSLSGEEITVSVKGRKQFIQDALVVDKIKASNGTIYLIDDLMLPPGSDY